MMKEPLGESNWRGQFELAARTPEENTSDRPSAHATTPAMPGREGAGRFIVIVSMAVFPLQTCGRGAALRRSKRSYTVLTRGTMTCRNLDVGTPLTPRVLSPRESPPSNRQHFDGSSAESGSAGLRRNPGE